MVHIFKTINFVGVPIWKEFWSCVWKALVCRYTYKKTWHAQFM